MTQLLQRSEMSNDAVCPCFGCQCEPNQVTKDAIEEARSMMKHTQQV